jgi:hypothetical protein
MLRLVADDEDVRAATVGALLAARDLTPALQIRCKECRSRILGRAGYVPRYGPLFTAFWRAEPLYTAGKMVIASGRTLRPRERAAWLGKHTEVTSKTEHADEPVSDGVIALLAVPVGLTADYPDLMVRCKRHGDALLDRLEILEALRAAAAGGDGYYRVAPSGQTYSYAAGRPLDTGATARQNRITLRHKADVMPVEEFDARLHARRHAEDS